MQLPLETPCVVTKMWLYVQRKIIKILSSFPSFPHMPSSSLPLHGLHVDCIATRPLHLSIFSPQLLLLTSHILSIMWHLSWLVLSILILVFLISLLQVVLFLKTSVWFCFHSFLKGIHTIIFSYLLIYLSMYLSVSSLSIELAFKKNFKSICYKRGLPVQYSVIPFPIIIQYILCLVWDS